MADAFLSARRMMAETGKMPPSAHDFALSDMAFSNSDKCFAAVHQNTTNTSEYVFYPGCQLSGIAPDLMQRCYEDLCERLQGGVGLTLGCCGIIAEWAGRRDLFDAAIEQNTDAFRRLGAKTVITACPSCYKIFKENMPEFEILGIWEVLSRDKHSGSGENVFAIHDPCTVRDMPEVQDGVRELAKKLGLVVNELDYNKRTTGCCAYGGLLMYANPGIADEVIAARADESEQPYLCYCINCRDQFVRKGKSAKHILEIYYDIDAGGFVRYSDRRENRRRMKQKYEGGEYLANLPLSISSELQEKLEKRLITAADLSDTIKWCEQSNEIVSETDSNLLIAYRKIGNVTFWVKFEKAENVFIIHSAYSHRMEITGGAAHE